MEPNSNSHLTYLIQPEDAGKRIRSIISSKLGLSRALVQKLRNEDRFRLNGNFVFLTQFCNPGDMLTVDINFSEDSAIIPENMQLDIIYEDEDFLVLNKPAGIIVHPVGKEIIGTLANGVTHHWLQQGLQTKFRPIHRLDRNTSGLVVVGKNQFAHQALYRQFHLGQVYREYLALVEGSIPDNDGTIDAPIARNPASIIERCVHPSGQLAKTHYCVVEAFNNVTLVRLTLETGRTHQIRVHMSHIGHPLLGDTLYGGSDLLIKRQALHSHVFQFIHPRHLTPIKFSAPLAEDIVQVIQHCKSRY